MPSMIYLDDTCFNITANGLKHWTFKSETIKLFRQIVFFFLQVFSVTLLFTAMTRSAHGESLLLIFLERNHAYSLLGT